jgi:hypothetical protein
MLQPNGNATNRINVTDLSWSATPKDAASGEHQNWFTQALLVTVNTRKSFEKHEYEGHTVCSEVEMGRRNGQRPFTLIIEGRLYI